MPTPKVWSEREIGTWDACVYASGLMLLVYGGKVDYPLGIYSNAEREALEASDDRPDETSANYPTLDVAVSRRYGVKLHQIADGSKAGVSAAMNTIGRGYAIAGQLSNFPAGHPLRRYAPGFTGFHSMFVVPLGASQVLWLDPLAPYGYAGDTVAVADVLLFAEGNYPSDARYLAAEELTTMPGYKIGTNIGTFKMKGDQPHALISPLDPKVRYMQVLGAGPWDVAAFLDLKDPSGKPIDIDGHQPPQNSRDQVVLVDAPGFGIAAWALKQDGTFTPKPMGHTDDELKQARTNGIADAAKSAAATV